jgi:hypothetical protein
MFNSDNCSPACAAIGRAVRLLGARHPALAGRLRDTLALVVDGIDSDTDRYQAWRFSQLNSNGTPVEFTFSTFSDEVRYAVEVGGPGLAHGRRLAAAGGLLRRLGAVQAGQASLDRLCALQRPMADALRWGAWLGVRHLAARDEYKIYAEVAGPAWPPGLTALMAQYVGPLPVLAGQRALQLVAIGQVPGSPRMEFYFRIGGLGMGADDLLRLLEPWGLAGGHAAMWELLRSLPFRFGAAHGAGAPQITYGFSCSVLPGRREAVGAVFAFADQLIGSDALVCIRLAQIWQRHGWPISPYLELAEPLVNSFLSADVHHNMIAVLLSADGRLGMHVTLSPPIH